MMNGREHTKYVLAKSGYEPEEKRCCSRCCKWVCCVSLTLLVIAGAAVAVYLVLFNPWEPAEACTNGVYLTTNKSSSEFMVNKYIGIKILSSPDNDTQLHYIKATIGNGSLQEELVYNLVEKIDQTWSMFTEISGAQVNNPVSIPELPVDQWLLLSFNRKVNDTALTVELQAVDTSYEIALDVSDVLGPDSSIVMGGNNSSAPYEVSYNC